MQAANHLFVQAADDFLKNQKAVDAALIFEDQVIKLFLKLKNKTIT